MSLINLTCKEVVWGEPIPGVLLVQSIDVDEKNPIDEIFKNFIDGLYSGGNLPLFFIKNNKDRIYYYCNNCK